MAILASPLGLVTVLALASVAAVACYAHLRIRKLTRLLADKSVVIEKNARLLVEKNIELSDQNIALEHSLEAKNDFIGVASHQLRTPLTEIKWVVEDILEKANGTLTAHQDEQIRTVLDSAKRMARLIDELLHFVDAEAGYRKYNISATPIEKTVTTVLDEAEKRFVKKDIVLSRSLNFGDQTLSVDGDMVAIAIGNLIDNAFYYTPPHGTIRVSTAKDAEHFVCTVADSGIGIPPDKRDDIFKKFRRSREALTLHSGGVGLGLYITKNIIDQHGGDITFTSTLGKGTTFTLTLPLKPVAR